MKTIKLLSLLLITAVAASCSSVRVSSDYDEAASFGTYKTYAFFKEGLDKADISDLDKKRIMRAIDAEMQQKGFTKSDKPDLLINLFTKSSQQVNVNNWGYGGFGWGWGYGYGWGPGFYGGYPMVTSYPEGTLYIDLVDGNKKELVWQGVGSGVLTRDRDEKQDRINEFVQKILAQFPPQEKK
ncbi:lipoprotein [Nostoc linckia z15]|nr:lipoprotein [Nostoc linckia z15]